MTMDISFTGLHDYSFNNFNLNTLQCFPSVKKVLVKMEGRVLGMSSVINVNAHQLIVEICVK